MRTSRIIFAGIIGLLSILLLQGMLPVFKIAPLKGDVSLPEKPEFSWRSWFDGSFQLRKDEYINETFGFRNIFVRINNQVDYSMFGIIHAKDVIEGKEGYLYELNYIKAATGEDYKGVAFLNDMMYKLKTIQESLKKKNVDFILLIAPGKASFFPEYIPDQYLPIRDSTNYQIITQSAKRIGVNLIDLNSLFNSQKNTSQYPLYPQYGIHWSVYGATVAFDTLLRYMENIRGVDLPDLTIDSIEMSNSFLSTDYDIADGMNLLFRKNSFPMAYPVVNYEKENKAKEMVLTIGDSYYWTIYGNGMAGQVFDKPKFWFFYQDLYAEGVEGKTPKDQVSLRTELESHDYVMLLCTEPNYSRMGWGFIDDAYKLYVSDSLLRMRQSRISEIQASIRATPTWFEMVKNKAQQKGVEIDSMIYMDAEYMFMQEQSLEK